MSTRDDTSPGFSFSDGTKAKAPLRVWIAILVFVAAGVAAWTTTKNDVANDARRIEQLEDGQRTLAIEARQQRDILIRIDANVAAMKERQK